MLVLFENLCVYKTVCEFSCMYVVGLSTGAIVGIVIGFFLMIMVLVVIGVTMIIIRRRTKELVDTVVLITLILHCL